MRSDARKRMEGTRRDCCGGVFSHKAGCEPRTYDAGYNDGQRDGYNVAIAQLRAIVTRHKPHGTFPAIVAVSDLYTLIGDPATWHDGGDAA